MTQADKIRRDTREYLGDGVYVEHDGYAICLFLHDGIQRHHDIYLEPEVFENLLNWKETVTKSMKGDK